MNRHALRAFATRAAAARASLWPITVTAAGSTARMSGSKSPTQLSRVQQEHGAGWTQRATATFLLPVSGTFRPDIGTQLTIVATETAEEMSTVWRCFDLQRGDDNIGTEHRLVCFRLDS